VSKVPVFVCILHGSSREVLHVEALQEADEQAAFRRADRLVGEHDTAAGFELWHGGRRVSERWPRHYRALRASAEAAIMIPYRCVVLDSAPLPVGEFEYTAATDAEATDLAFLRAVAMPTATAYEVWQDARRVACGYINSASRRERRQTQ
jgi:hypothetical protein